MIDITDREALEFIAKNVASIRSDKDNQLTVTTVSNKKVDVVVNDNHYDKLKDAVALLKIRYYDK